MDFGKCIGREKHKDLFMLSCSVKLFFFAYFQSHIFEYIFSFLLEYLSYPNITYHIIISRRPLFYVFNMILPSILITIVGFLGFLIPADSGEKVSMGVTTLLSMTVFLMVVAENMPPNSDSVPLIGNLVI